MLALGLVWILVVSAGLLDPRLSRADSKITAPVPAEPHSEAELCSTLQKYFTRYSWPLRPCERIHWESSGRSVNGYPLIWAQFGRSESRNKTIVFSMVHPDEITPLYVGFALAHWLRDNEAKLGDAHIIVAPMVNPDGLIIPRRPTRTNSRGVDLNRNFLTRDWASDAQKEWVRQKKASRRFPGNEANSEPETLFQLELLQKFKPEKVVSIHAPLNVLDYDGPSSITLEAFPEHYIEKRRQLRKQLRANTSGFFPGSLGNLSGHEMGVPTLTLELPSADWTQAKRYWERFQTGIRKMIEYRVEAPSSLESLPSP